jgi:transcriptional regulator NrdR family protein
MAKCPKCKDTQGKFIDSGAFMGTGISKEGKKTYRFHCVSCGEIFELEAVS